MIQDVRHLLDEYHAWLRDKTSLRQVDDWIEITTPYLDRHNDYVQIYASRENGAYVLTDDGYVIDDLEQSGCKLDSPKRQGLLRAALNGFGVRLNGRAIEVRATADNFAPRKHDLVQAMLAVDDLFCLASPIVASVFYEDVVAWLDAEAIRYTPKVKFTGKSGFDHLFDFVVPKSKAQPERVMRAINRPSRDTVEAFVFAWMDTREVRAADARALALLNDADREVPSSVLDALRTYDVRAVKWSERDSLAPELAA